MLHVRQFIRFPFCRDIIPTLRFFSLDNVIEFISVIKKEKKVIPMQQCCFG